MELFFLYIKGAYLDIPIDVESHFCDFSILLSFKISWFWCFFAKGFPWCCASAVSKSGVLVKPK